LTQATYVSTRIHTEPQAFGKVMSTIKPRLAVGYHSVQSPDNNAESEVLRLSRRGNNMVKSTPSFEFTNGGIQEFVILL